MNSVTNAMLSLAALAAAGCSTYEPPQTETISEAIDLSRFDTFTARINGSDTADTAFGPHARNEALEEIVEEFEDLGYEYVEGAAADFVVVFTSAIHDQSNTFVTSYSSPRREVVTREEQVVTPSGDVVTTERDSEVTTTYESKPITVSDRKRLYVLDVVDGSTDVLIWRGYMTSDDLEISDEDIIEDHIERIVERVPHSG